MTQAMELLAAQAGPDWLFFSLVFGAVVLSVLGIAHAFGRKNEVHRRLEEQAARRVADGASSLGFGKGKGAVQRLVQPFDGAFAPKDDERRSAVGRRLVQAGYMGPQAIGRYYGVRLGLGLLLAFAALLVTPLLPGSVPVEVVLLLTSASGLAGFFAPALWVAQRIQQRQQLAREGFPDALDMLLVCVEAGLSLAAALNRVGAELGLAHRLLGEQFRLVGFEMQAGKARADALRSLADRIGIDEVRSLVSLLRQSEELGTSIGQALRVHADEMRRKRLVTAEERANKLPVKIVLPLGLFIMPCLLIVILGPAAIRVANALLPALG